MKQLAIIGGGPAGIPASIYAARKKMDFVLITKEVGGQVIKVGNIENYLGYAMVDEGCSKNTTLLTHNSFKAKI
jgi:alkyl hydroperoxide reductase subunit F